MMENDVSKKTAIITGAASGIGEATALLFASHNIRVVVSDIDEGKGNALVDKIKQQDGTAIFVKTDVANPDECRQLVETAVTTYGAVDFCFNNAGISGESNPIADMSIEGWNRMIAINLSSVFYCMKYQIAQMMRQGGGAIVNNSSILGSVGFANSSAYVAAKHGVIGLTQTSAIEYSKSKIRINAVGPGFINTPLLSKAGMGDDQKSALVSLHPIGRLGEATEVAELVFWLCSDKASFITGSYYPVDGGYLAH